MYAYFSDWHRDKLERKYGTPAAMCSTPERHVYSVAAEESILVYPTSPLSRPGNITTDAPTVSLVNYITHIYHSGDSVSQESSF